MATRAIVAQKVGKFRSYMAMVTGAQNLPAPVGSFGSTASLTKLPETSAYVTLEVVPETFMQSRTWLLFLLSLLQMPGCAAAEKVTLDELSKSHPNCKLYGHFYAPQVIIFAPSLKPTQPFGRRASYQKETTSFGFGQQIKVSSKTSKSFSDLKEVDEFVHGNSQRFSGIDIDF